MTDRREHQAAGPATHSSRDTAEGAGWHCSADGSFRRLVPPGASPLSWLSPAPLFKCRNEPLVHWLGDPTNAQRQRWVATQRAAGSDPHAPVRAYADRDHVSFLALGDTGEGDASQYCVVPGLLQHAPETDFMVIASDVVYPAGDSAAYEGKFYRPYQDYPGPIYAVPGNHDWYDGLNGFMSHICGARATLTRLPRPEANGGGATDASWRRALRWLLWRRPARTKEASRIRMRGWRGRPAQQARQVGPYFALEAGPVMLVGVDTGITGELDREQGAWLRRVSRSSPKPKILISGLPIYVDATYQPARIEGTTTTLDDIVRAPENHYIAVIGGDLHNYQRYPVRVGDGRTIQHIVAGGGGAFMHGTHMIPRVDLPGVSEKEFRCYPLRGDSLSILSEIYQRRLGWLLGRTYVPPRQAAAFMAERLGTEPTRPGDRGTTVSAAARRAGQKVCWIPDHLSGPVQEYIQRFFDWNHAPMFKSFLRVDTGPDEVTIRCFAATGCRPHELDPPLEDIARCVRDSGGTWRWVTATS